MNSTASARAGERMHHGADGRTGDARARGRQAGAPGHPVSDSPPARERDSGLRMDERTP
jgi:hypothetical protein